MAQRRRRRGSAQADSKRHARPAPPTRSGTSLPDTIRGAVRNRPALCAIALASLHILLAALTFLPQPHTGGDNAAYIALGRSLLEHGTYTELWDPALAPHTKYPPVYPAILAGAMAVGLEPWAPLKFVGIALSAVAIVFSFLWIRARRRALLAIGVGFILAIAPGVLNEGRWELSDVPFWAFTMIALWAFERLNRDDWKRFAIGAAAILLAWFTRSAGLPLVLAALAWLAWRRRWKQLGALAVIIGLPALLWALRSRAYGPAGYTSEFWLVDPYAPALGTIGAGDLVQRVVDNITQYASVHLPMLLSSGRTGPVVLLGAVLCVLAVIGWIRCMRAPHVADLFLPLYAGLIFIWPAVWSGERFLLPVLPLLLYYAALAIGRFNRRFVPSYGFVTAALCAAMLVIAAIPGLVRAAEFSSVCRAEYRAGNRYPCLGGPMWDEFFDVAGMTRTALPDSAVVISRKPRLFYGLSGHRSSIYRFSTEPSDFLAVADSIGARYVVYDMLGATSQAYLRPTLIRKAGAFCIMHVTPVTGTILFGIRADHASVPDLGAASLNDPQGPAFSRCDQSYWRNADAMQTFGRF